MIKSLSKIKRKILTFKEIIVSTLFWKKIYLQSNKPSDLIKSGFEVYPKLISESECFNIISEIRNFERAKSPPNDKNDNSIIDTKITQYYNIDEKITKVQISELGDRFSKIIENSLDNKFMVKRNACVYQKDDLDIDSTKRPLHIDSFTGTHKAFLYLTNVLKPGYGPYNYIKSSHRKYIFLKLINQFINIILNRPNNSMHSFCESLIPPRILTYEKGTVILANQTGLHKGHSPQNQGIREIIMFYYSIESKEKEVTHSS